MNNTNNESLKDKSLKKKNEISSTCSFCMIKPIYFDKTEKSGKTISYCKNHFMKNFEEKVFQSIKANKLIKNNEKIVCATSGGKDSLTVLYLAKKYIEENKFNSSIEAIVIDEGIPGYRDKTVQDVKNFCKKYKIKLKISSFKESYGLELVKILEKRSIKKELNKTIKIHEQNSEKQGSPCTTCGILRRDLLNKSCIGKYDKIITGHNMDDEVQTALMNMLFGKTDLLARMGPVTGISEVQGFVQRVKPLYLRSEKEVTIYALLKGFRNEFTECPNAKLSFRAFIRDELNSLENSREIKCNITKALLEILPELKKNSREKSELNQILKKCISCGSPSALDECKSCIIVKEIQDL